MHSTPTMPSSSGSGSSGPHNTVNIHCSNCDSQIGIYENDWIRVSSSFILPKDKGINFNVIISDKGNAVTGGHYDALRGCILCQTSCAKCIKTVGQYCRDANASRDLVGQHLYKMTSTYLKDSRSAAQVEPTFGPGIDLSQQSRSHSTFTAPPKPFQSLSSCIQKSQSRRNRHSMAPPEVFRQSRILHDPTTPLSSSHQNAFVPATGIVDISQKLNSERATELNVDEINSIMAPGRDSMMNHGLDAALGNQQQQAASVFRILEEYSRKFDELTQGQRDLKIGMGAIMAQLKRSIGEPLIGNTPQNAATPLLGEFGKTVCKAKESHSQAEEYMKLMTENEAMKAKLQTVYSTPNTAFFEDTSVSSPAPSAASTSGTLSLLGKRKRAFIERRTSLLQKEVTSERRDVSNKHRLRSEEAAAGQVSPRSAKWIATSPHTDSGCEVERPTSGIDSVDALAAITHGIDPIDSPATTRDPTVETATQVESSQLLTLSARLTQTNGGNGKYEHALTRHERFVDEPGGENSRGKADRDARHESFQKDELIDGGCSGLVTNEQHTSSDETAISDVRQILVNATDPAIEKPLQADSTTPETSSAPVAAVADDVTERVTKDDELSENKRRQVSQRQKPSRSLDAASEILPSLAQIIMPLASDTKQPNHPASPNPREESSRSLSVPVWVEDVEGSGNAIVDSTKNEPRRGRSVRQLPRNNDVTAAGSLQVTAASSGELGISLQKQSRIPHGRSGERDNVISDVGDGEVVENTTKTKLFRRDISISSSSKANSAKSAKRKSQRTSAHLARNSPEPQDNSTSPLRRSQRRMGASGSGVQEPPKDLQQNQATHPSHEGLRQPAREGVDSQDGDGEHIHLGPKTEVDRPAMQANYPETENPVTVGIVPIHGEAGDVFGVVTHSFTSHPPDQGTQLTPQVSEAVKARHHQVSDMTGNYSFRYPSIECSGSPLHNGIMQIHQGTGTGSDQENIEPGPLLSSHSRNLQSKKRRPLRGPNKPKRHRAKPEDVDRKFKCLWEGCDRAYGRLPHLNTHITDSGHGARLSMTEYRETVQARGQEFSVEQDDSFILDSFDPMVIDPSIRDKAGEAEQTIEAQAEIEEQQRRVIRDRDRLAKEAMEREELLELGLAM